MDSELICFLVDDDEDDREIFGMALARTSVKADLFTAENGSDALKKIHNELSFIPDYIFLDINMPGMSGFDCLTEIKRVNRLKSVPVIIYSTSSAPTNLETATALKAAHYLVKPTSITLLTNVLQDLFHSKNLPFLLNQNGSNQFH